MWNSVKKAFHKKCYNPAKWIETGSQGKLLVVSKTKDFISEAVSLAEKYPLLAKDIYSQETIELIIEVIPPETFKEVLKKMPTTPDKDWKVVFKLYEDEIEKLYTFELNANIFDGAIKRNTNSYSGCIKFHKNGGPLENIL